MNNKGFTLVELIATIALLAIISIISFVSINAVIDRSKVSECESLVSNIKSGVKEYVSDNRYNKDFDVSNIRVSDLNLSGTLINPFDNDDDDTNDKLDDSNVKIEVTLNRDLTVKKIDIKNSEGELVDCSSGEW